jgi:SNF2 family DNA or RNA helicase
MLVHPQTAAHGLNLQRGGRAIIWFAMPWNLEWYDQLNARIWRQGQKKPVIVHQIVARGTIDRKIQRVLKDKDAVQRGLLAALKKEYGKG